METLKDIKQALKDIPDEVLDRVFFGIGEGTEETVSLIALETDGDIVGYPEIWDKYPELSKIDKLVKNVQKAQEVLESQEQAEELSENLQQSGITDTYFDKKKEE